MQYADFVREVASRTGVSNEQAEALGRATLETLGDRVSGGEADDLAAKLPDPLAAALDRPRDKPADRFGLAEFVRRVSERSGLDEATAGTGVRAVLTKLREASAREFDDVVAELPGEFASVTGSTGSRSATDE